MRSLQCIQCRRTSYILYKCVDCEEPYYGLCLECVARLGREAHSFRFGPSHQFQSPPEAKECRFCHNEEAENARICIQCNFELGDSPVICHRCYSIHENLITHSKGNVHAHTFKVLDQPKPMIEDPTIYFHERHNPPRCTLCRSMIRNDFFRCIDCATSFNLCDRCADDGGMAKHICHTFEFAAPTVNRAANTAGRPPNPES